MYVAAVILAAGKGTRMKSRFPKVTHAVGGRPMLEHVLRAASEAILPESDIPASGDAEDHSSPRFVVVVGHERETVRERVQWSPPQGGGLTYIEQEPQLGTGDAVRAALAAWRSEPSPDTILVLYGDTPLVRADTLRALLQEHAGSGATLTFLTGITDRPGEYGRVVRDAAGQVRGIVEKRHATGEQLAIPEVNSGIYCIAAAWLWSRLERLEPHENGEYYLTDLVEVAVREGQHIATTSVALEETIGVNDRVQLAEAEHLLRERTLRELMLSGVTVEDPAATYVECGVRVGQDTILRPGTRLLGRTAIGERCEIGPQSVVRDSEIGDDCLVLASWVEEARMAARSRVGPFSHLRPGARLESGAHVGNFGEVKNATIGAGVQMHHFSYIGDANVGAGANIGAGVVTVNYDGQQKHHTEIGERAFIGSDTMLRAPVTVGDEAATGAGSVVTRDVPRGTLVAGVPARQVPRVRPVGPDARPDHPPERETRTAESSPELGIQSEDVGWGEGE